MLKNIYFINTFLLIGIVAQNIKLKLEKHKKKLKRNKYRVIISSLPFKE